MYLNVIKYMKNEFLEQPSTITDNNELKNGSRG